MWVFLTRLVEDDDEDPWVVGNEFFLVVSRIFLRRNRSTECNAVGPSRPALPCDWRNTLEDLGGQCDKYHFYRIIMSSVLS